MREIGITILSLGLLYVTRRKIVSELVKLIGFFGGGRRGFTIIWSAIFLPGTIIHEISHFFAAAATGTKIGKIEIFPHLSDSSVIPAKAGTYIDSGSRKHSPGMTKGGHIRLGSVQTQELGIIRGFIVGAAPFIIGLGLLIWISSVLRLTIYDLRLLDLAFLYLFFTISNSLFLSWSDIKQTLPLIVIAAIAASAFYASGIRPAVVADSPLLALAAKLQTALLWSVGINFAVTVVLASLNWLTRKFK